ncbi:secretion/conjugation apparatus DotM-related subunit [Ferrimonas marina]|uniref:DotM C-terminal cytoplasmic domain-containing protein n=1 Tax=Ferrimonas marina TaxID=299255 RepID=A0A1M5TCB1_9GAMM|nr:hypothetical protein [Ferrimonas marina]SHH48260.1 hypothetical protein SAMN02745129_2078 [Ferrimonas marina]
MSEQKSDSGYIIIAVAVIAAVHVLVSYTDVLAFVWRWVRIAELAPFQVLPMLHTGDDWFGREFQTLKTAFEFLLEATPDQLDAKTREIIDRHVAKYLYLTFGLLFLGIGVRRFQREKRNVKIHNMSSLLAQNAAIYPSLQPYLDTDPAKVDIQFMRGDKSSEASAASLDPGELALMAPPLGLEERAKRDTSLNRAIWDGADGFDEDLARECLIEQLGRRFTGIQHLEEHEAELYKNLVSNINPTSEAIRSTVVEFSQHIMGEAKRRPTGLLPEEQRFFTAMVKETDKLGKKAKQWDRHEYEKHFVFSPVFIEAYKQIVGERVMSRHGYIRSGLMSLMDEARGSGVVASESMRSLKALDRPLWYCMSTEGREVTFAESMGPFCQRLVEDAWGKAIPVPEVEAAIDGWKRSLGIGVED